MTCPCHSSRFFHPTKIKRSSSYVDQFLSAPVAASSEVQIFSISVSVYALPSLRSARFGVHTKPHQNCTFVQLTFLSRLLRLKELCCVSSRSLVWQAPAAGPMLWPRRRLRRKLSHVVRAAAMLCCGRRKVRRMLHESYRQSPVENSSRRQFSVLFIYCMKLKDVHIHYQQPSVSRV
jgi:hypothetical protein